MILQKVYQFLRLFTIIILLILIQSFYFTHILHSSESLVYNRFYMYTIITTIVYNQCSIYSGTKLSISNFECPNYFTTAVGQWHLIIIHTCMPSIVLYVIHVDLYDYKLKFSVPHVQFLIVIHS